MNVPLQDAVAALAAPCETGERLNPAPRISISAAAEAALGEHRLRLICVDGIVPQHAVPRPGARARLVYVRGEVTHFELTGHRYAIVCAEPEAMQGRAEPHDTEKAPDIRALLTNRELQIVQLICMGCLTKQVSDRLRISEFTVRSYLKTIYCKLGVRSRAAMVYRYAQSFGHREAPAPDDCAQRRGRE